MTMTMRGSRVDGTVDKNKILRRFKNLLNLTYLQAQPLEEGGYRIPEKLFESIQTELDFSVCAEEAQTKKLEEQIKRRYRQRNSYRFWKDALDISNIANDVDAKEFLMKIYVKLDTTMHYGSMTHSLYALETMQLALDDVYGTNNTILRQYKFLRDAFPQKTKAKKKAKKATKKAKKIDALETADDIPEEILLF